MAGSSVVLVEAPIRVLIVEGVTFDKALILEMLRSDEHSTFDCEHVANLTSACNQLEGNTFDCLLVDMDLPDSKGLQTLRRVQAASGAAVVVLAELDEPVTAEAAQMAGAHDYLTKGRFDRRRLAGAIRHAVERQTEALAGAL